MTNTGVRGHFLDNPLMIDASAMPCTRAFEVARDNRRSISRHRAIRSLRVSITTTEPPMAFECRLEVTLVRSEGFFTTQRNDLAVERGRRRVRSTLNVPRSVSNSRVCAGLTPPVRRSFDHEMGSTRVCASFFHFTLLSQERRGSGSRTFGIRSGYLLWSGFQELSFPEAS